MSFADRFASRLSAPASRVLDGPIREIVQQVLREGGYATPAEVDQLRGEARDLARRVDALDARATELAAQTEGLKTRVQAAESRATALVGEVQAASARVAALEGTAAALAAAESRLAVVEAELARARENLAAALEARGTQTASAPAEVHAPASPSAPVAEAARAPVGTLACKVEGCTGNVRSKGFCSAHYQQWRRGTLKGYVNQDGTVSIDGKSYTLSESWAGGLATVAKGKVYVDGVLAG
jgi:hypothetical protein